MPSWETARKELEHSWMAHAPRQPGQSRPGYFDMDAADPLPIALSWYMADKEPVWESLATEA